MKIKLPLLAFAALLFMGLPLHNSSARLSISVGIAPPAIPIYAQPYCPYPGYIWTPGYWAWDGYGYYWAPGVWVSPPRVGLLWTPGYWGYRNGLYAFNDGYWGTSVGFYGGINYGYGYGGYGYYGGRWSGNTFLYNTAVTRVGRNINTTYVNREVGRNTGSRAGFNGPGGAKAKPTSEQLAAAKGKRIAATSAQRERIQAAKNNPELKARNNKGKPKAEAVEAFHKNRPDDRNAPDRGDTAKKNRDGQNVDTNDNGRGNDRQANDNDRGNDRQVKADRQPAPEKAKRNADRQADTRKAKEKADRPERSVAKRERSAKPETRRAPQRTVERARPDAPQVSRKRPQIAPQRQAVRRAPTQAGRRAPAPAQEEQQGKKKKKKPEDR
ncbi:MAG: hypothetical protein M3Q46_01010 [Verrucomicrobiota bacterium]|nr:hypothetical protein [Verrucomicrobiota bacterium]